MTLKVSFCLTMKTIIMLREKMTIFISNIYIRFLLHTEKTIEIQIL